VIGVASPGDRGEAAVFPPPFDAQSRPEYAAPVLFSSDTDLLPALETVARYKLGHVEVACWSGFKPLSFPASNLPCCHFLNEADWAAVIEDWQGRF
jgi:hypothetical protein